MELLSVLSRLLDYPTAELGDLKAPMIELVNTSGLSQQNRAAVIEFIERRLAGDLMDWQAEYDGLFERGRSLGLWLFEHVHGESRDRGQAMVDLLNQYRLAGLELDSNELPDYIPLFLEFLATQGDSNAREWLQDVEHILATLLCRLENRNSDYAVLFTALLDAAHSRFDVAQLRQQLAGEKRDDSRQAIDKEWEEEAVTFGAPDGGACSSTTNRPSENQRRDLDIPVTWTGFNQCAQ
ncbi:MAG: nitrate reductase molybdenum cofactor assembly chaperone [Porticoccaceae bacterium]|jgi:nitrate reductase delta subunit|nr:nitrate reductase molybdenum cofactor assembly chaperone [Porticoccaceae bacterium]